VGEAATRALDLPRTRLAAQLRDDLADLRRAGGADRVALGLQPARRVYGDRAAQARPALLGGEAARARLEEAEPFGGDDLRDGEAVVQLDDVDVVELHDCFTIAEIVATEGLGLFEPGAGGLAAEKGWTSLGGPIPVNPSGGLKAKGHPIGATGAAQICEVVTQLRGEAGPRQVEGARRGLTHTLGGNTATVLVSLFGRE